AAYDGHAHQLVAIGTGVAGPETWLWSGTDWGRVTPATEAPAGMLVFDRSVNRLLSFGWTNGVLHTWVWDGRTWSMLAVAATSPTPMRSVVAAYDPALGGTVLMGESGSEVLTWLLRAGSWTALPSPALSATAAPVVAVWNA